MDRNSDKPFEYTDDELSVAFCRVSPPHWKDEINCKIFARADEIEVVKAAIIFFTATVPTITHLGNFEWEVKSTGYRNGPAGQCW